MMQSFFSQANARGARSTALHALQWTIGLFLSAIALLVFAGAPSWLLVGVASALSLVLLVFLGAYIYLLFHNPDALRSEHFSLSKMAIEKGLVGDNVSGLIDPMAVDGPSSRRLALTANDEDKQ
jgi:hypothetical protein